jgi:deazaflavin-dependent oxidoreductase (nitroreductase family)
VSAVQLVTDLGLKAMNAIHHGVLTLTGGRLGHRILGMQAVELHTTGRKSGQRRTVMLTSPVYDPDRVVLVASKGGDDRPPDWYRNLVADPDVELTVKGATRPMLARTASPEERAALWPSVVRAYRGYALYQKRTSREIPLVILEPRPG